jgi:hypothetical protein
VSNCSDAIKAAWIGVMLATGCMTMAACDEGEIEEIGEEIDDAVDDATDETEDEVGDPR